MNICKNCKLVGIKWNRVFLQLEIAADLSGAEFYLVSNLNEQDLHNSIHIAYDKCVDLNYFFNINICQVNGRSFLENGKWFIIARYDGKDEIVPVAVELAYDFDNLSRIFQYGTNKSYCVSFSAEEIQGNLCVGINSCFMKTDDDWKSRGTGVKKRLLNAAIGLYDCLAGHRNKKNNVLFLSQTKDELGGNLKAVADRLVERGYDKRYNITYRLRDDVGRGQERKGLIKLALLISKQKIIFVEDYVPAFSILSPANDTILVQLWHAGIGFKAVGYCRFGKSGSPHPLMSCHRKYDYALSPTAESIDVFREVFGIERDAFMISGMPRMDGFLDKKRISDFKDSFYAANPFLKDKKIILFAPTYRGRGQSEAYYDYDMLEQDAIADVCGDEYAFLIKMHPFVADKIKIKDEYKNTIYDFSGVDDINNLYYVTDILITDYSSNFFEYTALERPIIFYTYDREIYELTRGVHAPIKETAPGIVCDTFNEVIDAIQNGNFEIEKTRAFRKKYWNNDDNKSADIIIDRVFEENRHG